MKASAKYGHGWTGVLSKSLLLLLACALAFGLAIPPSASAKTALHTEKPRLEYFLKPQACVGAEQSVTHELPPDYRQIYSETASDSLLVPEGKANLGVPRVASKDMLASPNRIRNKLDAWHRYEGDWAFKRWSKNYDTFQANRIRGKNFERIYQKRGLGIPDRKIPTPIGGRIPDVVDTPIFREIKSGDVSLSKFTRRQILKGFWLKEHLDCSLNGIFMAMSALVFVKS